jgi:hypothetical protein
MSDHRRLTLKGKEGKDLMSDEVLRCSYCGLFYTLKTVSKHWICQKLEDQKASGV